MRNIVRVSAARKSYLSLSDPPIRDKSRALNYTAVVANSVNRTNIAARDDQLPRLGNAIVRLYIRIMAPLILQFGC